MKEIGHEQRMCDSCEKKAVGIILWPLPISDHERKCLKKNIIPYGVSSVSFNFIRVQQDEESVIPIPLWNISVVLCGECCLKDREETMNAVAVKPRILQEAIESTQIYIDELIRGISDKEKEAENLAEKIKRLTDDICSTRDSLVRKERILADIKSRLS